MEILKPVQEAPAALHGRRAKFQEAYDATVAADGMWVPVAMESAITARSLYLSARTHRKLSFEAKLRGLTVYLRLRKTA